MLRCRLGLAFAGLAVAALTFSSARCRAEDITTITGKTYKDISEVKTMPDGIIFSAVSDSGPVRVKVSFSELPEEVKKRHGYDPFEEGLYKARQDKTVSLKLDSAFRMADLPEAKKRAQAEGKMLGFIMVWDQFFRPAHPMGRGGANALAGFYTVFHNSLVLVFVRHESELNLVPAAVRKGFLGPEEGGFAPNMAVVSSDASQFICEIPLGGSNSDGSIRESLFKKKIAEIKNFR